MTVVACQPALVLSPRTIQNGPVGSCTTTVADVAPEWGTVSAGAAPDCTGSTRPAGARQRRPARGGVEHEAVDVDAHAGSKAGVGQHWVRPRA